MTKKAVPGEIIEVSEPVPFNYGLVTCIAILLILVGGTIGHLMATHYNSECVIKETEQAWAWRTRVYGPCRLVQEKKVWEQEWQKVSVEKWQAEYTSNEDVIDVTPRQESSTSTYTMPDKWDGGIITFDNGYSDKSSKKKGK